MAKRKTPEVVPSFRDLLVRTVEEFCTAEGIYGTFIIEEIAEDAQIENLEEAQLYLSSLLEEAGLDVDRFFIRVSEHLDKMPRKSIGHTHMSVFEAMLKIRAAALEQGSERSEHVAFGIARLFADRLRPSILARVGTAPTYPEAIRRALALAASHFPGDRPMDAYFQEKIRELQEGEGFLRQIYEKILDEFRREQVWRAALAEALDGTLSEDQLQKIREQPFLFDDDLPIPPSQSTCIYQVVVKYWLPQAGVGNPVEFLAERSIKNPEEGQAAA